MTNEVPPVSAQGTDLREWVQHKPNCAIEIAAGLMDGLPVGYIDPLPPQDCSCGLDAALAAPPKPVFKIHATDGTPCFSDQASGPSCGNDAHYRPPTYDDWMGHSPAVNGPHHCAKCGVEIALAAPPTSDSAGETDGGRLDRGRVMGDGATRGRLYVHADGGPAAAREPWCWFARRVGTDTSGGPFDTADAALAWAGMSFPGEAWEAMPLYAALAAPPLPSVARKAASRIRMLADRGAHICADYAQNDMGHCSYCGYHEGWHHVKALLAAPPPHADVIAEMRKVARNFDIDVLNDDEGTLDARVVSHKAARVLEYFADRIAAPPPLVEQERKTE
jgi:hypothetical protein